MKKKKITGLSLGKNTISSFKASNLSGGTDTYFCWTHRPPCRSFTEPPEDPTFICIPTTGNDTGNSNGCPTNQSCGDTCSPTCNTGGGSVLTNCVPN